MMNTAAHTSLVVSISAALLLCATSNADAALIVKVSPDAPALEQIYKYRDLDPDTTGAGLTVYHRTNGSKRFIGQQFNTTGASDGLALNAVTFYVSSADTDVLGTTFSLQIYESTSVTTKPSAAESVYTETGTFPLEWESGSYLTMELSRHLVLKPDHYYTVVFEFTGTTGSGGAATFRTLGDGIANTPLNRFWAATHTSDWGFNSTNNGLVTYIHTTQAIPEPASTALLLGFAISGLAWRRLRRSKP